MQGLTSINRKWKFHFQHPTTECTLDVSINKIDAMSAELPLNWTKLVS